VARGLKDRDQGVEKALQHPEKMEQKWAEIVDRVDLKNMHSFKVLLSIL
jgi:hypothetical protein